MLQLAHASREVLAAKVKFRLLSIHELDVMRTIAHDKYEEAIFDLKKAESQIGEMRHVLTTRGTEITTLSSLKLSPVPQTHADSADSLSESSLDSHGGIPPGIPPPHGIPAESENPFISEVLACPSGPL